MGNSGKIVDLDSLLDFTKEYAEKFDFNEKIRERMGNMANLNIVNIGKTGVGKSTLINAIFGRKVAEIGIGRPQTQHCKPYSVEGSPITIYDSKGIEIGNIKDLDEIYNLILEQKKSSNTKQYIHICWYCINAEGLRIEPEEVSIIKKFRNQNLVPVIVVLTQFSGSPNQKEFLAKVRSEFSDCPLDVLPIMAIPKVSKSEFGEQNIRAHGLDKLVERSYELLEGSVKRTFAAYQKQNLQIKIDNARKLSIAYAGAVAAAAFQPLPIADAPIMVAIQVGMMVNITACFGFDSSKLNFKTILSGLGGPFAAAFVGRTLVSLIKLIPGIGTGIGGAINAATGAALTFAIGNIYIGVLESIEKRNGEIDGQTIAEELKIAMQNVNMDAMKKEWKKVEFDYSESEAQDILNEAKKNLE